MSRAAETLIRTEGCYLGIFDRSAAIHREESIASIFDKARADAERAQNSWATLYYINERFVQRTRLGEILVCIVLFDGCFKARIKVLASDEDPLPANLQVGAFLADETHLLNCPTGNILVTSLHNLGRGDVLPTIEVEPGVYGVGLFRDDEQEDKHMFLEREIDYPADDGPDWLLVLNKVA